MINHPSPQARIHYLVIPKKDIKNIAEMSDADGEYLLDALKVAGVIIRENNADELSAHNQRPGLSRSNLSPFSLNR